tara:strand:+ start:749 stop:1060 length:312 start_codon:yes stop_codon:yes gene_type:complete
MKENETVLLVNSERVQKVQSVKIIQDEDHTKLVIRTLFIEPALEEGSKVDAAHIKLIINNYRPHSDYTGPSMLTIVDANASIRRNYLDIEPEHIRDVCYTLEL